MIRSACKSARNTLSLAAIAAAIAGASDAVAQAPATVNVAVDATAAGTPLEKVWPFHGYDEVNYTTTAPGQSLLQTLGAIHTVSPHIRTHFLLNTGDGTPSLKWGSTNAYTEDANGNPIYSFTLLDGIMDSITQAGTLPLVEIAFMPHDLATDPDPYQNSGIYTLDGHCFNPPKDFTKWGNLIRAWATHTKDRYANAETNWQWELWNEPDIGYWHGTPAQYLMLYDYTEAALHQVFPGASLGGPAVAGPGSALFTQFLQHCATGVNAVTGAIGTRLDMISFHAKGGAAIAAGHVELNLGNQLRLHRTGFTAVAAVPQFKQTPIVITEADPDGCAACPVSTNPEDAYRNSPAYGAYEVAMMKRTLELEARVGVKVRGLLTWAFLFNNTPYFAGYRALATNGIHLPVLNAFKLLGSLDGTRLPVTSSGSRTLDDILTNSVRAQADVDAMATRDGQRIQILVWNYHDELVAAAASPVHLAVTVPASFGTRATVSHLRVDDTHGNAYTLWVSQGSPAAPSAAQIAALQQAMQPAAIDPTHQVDVAAGTVGIDFMLPRFGISLLTLDPVGAADASADGTTSIVDSGMSAADTSVGQGGGGRADLDATQLGADSSSGAGGTGGTASGGSAGASGTNAGTAGSATGATGGSTGAAGGGGATRVGIGVGGASANGGSCSCRIMPSVRSTSLPRAAGLALLAAALFHRRACARSRRMRRSN
jgi:xylan 1,4-beta-xylosidase